VFPTKDDLACEDRREFDSYLVHSLGIEYILMKSLKLARASMKKNLTLILDPY